MKFTTKITALAALTFLSQSSLAAPLPLYVTAADLMQQQMPVQARSKPMSAAQQAQFAAEMKAQNAMQQQTTEEEFAQKMNDAAWKTASSAASDKIQRSEPMSAAQQAQFAAEMKAQNEMQQQTTEEEFAQRMNDAAWKTASSAASDKIH
jgi:hypothetical protein